jgi:hypothetical protein
LRECLWLIKHGIPFDVAFQVDDITRTAWCIVFSEQEDNRFNWDSMTWDEPE